MVIFYLRSVMNQFTEMCKHALQWMCLDVDRQLQLQPLNPELYSWTSLPRKDGLLSLRGPLENRSGTANVVFILGQKRQREYVCYRGLMTSSSHLYIHFTRAKDRLYWLGHSLFEEQSRWEDARQKLSSEYARERDQIFYENLWNHTKTIWKQDLDLQFDLTVVPAKWIILQTDLLFIGECHGELLGCSGSACDLLQAKQHRG